ncbi:Serine/threonine-protein phosphatase 2A activator 2, partial [Coelomomyces lativittatus]
TISEKLNSWIPNKAAIPELSKYLEHCFGDRQRIDYGTGHEAHFLCFLYCLHQLSLYSIQDYPAVVLRIFARHVSLFVFCTLGLS